MSRNLGAGAADLSTAAYGLYYQWGRKDPFPGVDNPGGGDNTITLIDTSLEVGKVTYSIQHPATFLMVPDGTNDDDWLWGARDNTLWGQGEDKSVYDPCPSGWRVPQFTTLNNEGSPWYGFTAGNGPWSESDGKGRDWSTATYNDGEEKNLFDPQNFAVYPASGYRNSASGALGGSGSGGYAWSSAVTGADGYRLSFSSAGVNPLSNNARAYGFPVRCVSE
jgi:uncharacterized protein (TIGR02145 family)